MKHDQKTETQNTSGEMSLHSEGQSLSPPSASGQPLPIENIEQTVLKKVDTQPSGKPNIDETLQNHVKVSLQTAATTIQKCKKHPVMTGFIAAIEAHVVEVQGASANGDTNLADINMKLDLSAAQTVSVLDLIVYSSSE